MTTTTVGERDYRQTLAHHDAVKERIEEIRETQAASAWSAANRKDWKHMTEPTAPIVETNSTTPAGETTVEGLKARQAEAMRKTEEAETIIGQTASLNWNIDIQELEARLAALEAALINPPMPTRNELDRTEPVEACGRKWPRLNVIAIEPIDAAFRNRRRDHTKELSKGLQGVELSAFLMRGTPWSVAIAELYAWMSEAEGAKLALTASLASAGVPQTEIDAAIADVPLATLPVLARLLF